MLTLPRFSAVAVGLLAISLLGSPLLGQDPAAKPVVGIFSIRSVNTIVGELEKSFKATRNQEAYEHLQTLVEANSYGIDFDKPIGLLTREYDAMEPIDFLAVASLQVEDGETQFRGIIAMLTQVIGKPEELPGGVYRFRNPGRQAAVEDPGFPATPAKEDPFGLPAPKEDGAGDGFDDLFGPKKEDPKPVPGDKPAAPGEGDSKPASNFDDIFKPAPEEAPKDDAPAKDDLFGGDNSPFLVAQVDDDPFGAPAAETPKAPASDPFGAPAGADPFGAPPAQDPFGAPAGDTPKPAADDPFGAPPAKDPFGAPAGDTPKPAADDPFGAPPAKDPFGLPAGDTPKPPGADPFGAPPAKDPFGLPAGDTPKPPGADPFGLPTEPASDPDDVPVDVIPADAGHSGPPDGLDFDAIYLVERNGMLIASTDEAWLRSSPADPTTLLEGLPEQHDLALRFQVSKLPPKFFENMEEELANGPDESELPDNFNENVSKAAREAESLTFSVDIDGETSEATIAYALTAKADTDLLAWFTELGEAQTKVAGIRNPAASLQWSITTPLRSETAKSLIDWVENSWEEQVAGDHALSEEEKKMEELAGKMIPLLLNAEQLDVTMSMKVEPQNSLSVFGGQVEDDKALVEMYKEIYRAIDADPGLTIKKADVDRDYRGFYIVDLHCEKIVKDPEEESEKHFQRLFGSTVHIALARGHQTFYVAMGVDATNRLKKIMDQSLDQGDQPIAPFQLRFGVGDMARLANLSLDEAPETEINAMAQNFLGSWAELENQDHVTLEMLSQPRGAKVQVRVEGMLLNSLTKLASSFLTGEEGVAVDDDFPAPIEVPIEVKENPDNPGAKPGPAPAGDAEFDDLFKP
ncbi:hypothetical protein [Lignipirellula cremea]|uniref:Uncharacterized protein n=1 Tax=Lignipirellula cremea TaxID=2528010 RepID=A0A518DWX8_9BACT|nr:hypothetical protein [Lignipirellula cremea]QDU96341.1 hypothetical protein Pla8534_41610 [Lignipirellula cremea]